MIKQHDQTSEFLVDFKLIGRHVSVIMLFIHYLNMITLDPRRCQMKKICGFDPGCGSTSAMSLLDLYQCPEVIASLPSVHCLLAVGGRMLNLRLSIILLLTTVSPQVHRSLKLVTVLVQWFSVNHFRLPAKALPALMCHLPSHLCLSYPDP